MTQTHKTTLFHPVVSNKSSKNRKHKNMMEFLYIPYNVIIPFIPKVLVRSFTLSIPFLPFHTPLCPVKLSRLKRPSCKAWGEKDHPIWKGDSKKDTTHPWAHPRQSPGPQLRKDSLNQPVGEGCSGCVPKVCCNTLRNLDLPPFSRYESGKMKGFGWDFFSTKSHVINLWWLGPGWRRGRSNI